jgi:hypothetical protein
VCSYNHILKKTLPWPESTNELYRPRDLRLLAKLVPIFADRGYHVISVMDPYGPILSFLDGTMTYYKSFILCIHSWTVTCSLRKEILTGSIQLVIRTSDKSWDSSSKEPLGSLKGGDFFFNSWMTINFPRPPGGVTLIHFLTSVHSFKSFWCVWLNFT